MGRQRVGQAITPSLSRRISLPDRSSTGQLPPSMITTPLFEGIAQAWLRLYEKKRARDDEPSFLAPGAHSKHFQGDTFDAARACLGELGWSMNDSRSSRPPNRRHWDITEQGRLGGFGFVHQSSQLESRQEVAVSRRVNARRGLYSTLNTRDLWPLTERYVHVVFVLVIDHERNGNTA